MDIETVAAAIDGVQYRDEDIRFDRSALKEAGIVVAFGASDDLLEFRGAIYDEVGAYEGGSAYVGKSGLIDAPDCDCRAAEELYNIRRAEAKKVEAVWCPDDCDGASWLIKSGIPHATFKVMEGDELYCVGIVFDLNNLEAS